MSRMGYHWTPCDRGSGGGGGGGAVVLVVLAVIIVVIARPVAHAADVVGHVLVEALEIAAIVVAFAAGLAALAGMAYVARLAVRRHGRSHHAIPRQASVVLRASRAVSARRARAIEAPRPRLIRLHPEPGRLKKEE